LRTNCLLQ